MILAYYSQQNGINELEIRLASSLGYLINPTNKLELGPDYRLRNATRNSFNQNLWVKMGWFYYLPELF